MHNINVAAGALNQIPLDWDGNLSRIKQAIKMAEDAGVSLLCLPELCVTGYGCEDAFFSDYVHRKSMEMVTNLIDSEFKISYCVGFPLYYNRAIYNAVAFITPASAYLIPKQNLCADGVHYEPRWFKPWPAGLKDEALQLGDQVIEMDGVRIGFEICEDAWVAKRPGISLSERGVDIIMNPSASHFAFGKHEIRRSFVIEGSRAFRCAYIYANLLGNESGRIIFDGDTFIASGGKMIVEGPRFSFQDVVVTCATIDVQENKTAQVQNNSYKSSGSNILNAGTALITSDKIPNGKAILGTNKTYRSYNKEDEFSEAVALGLFDYVRKSHSSGFVVSLSGGADSSAVCVLISSMYDLANKELGPYEVPKKIGFERNHLLTCVYQGANNSSTETLESARRLANSLGAVFMNWDISNIVSEYTELVEDWINRKLTWDEDDVTLQNIQARVRSPGAWMIANIKNALFLTTSNRSEAAVGYCTLDGDTSGGLSPIAGIDKAFLLRWIGYMYKEKGYYGLDSVIKLKPTAELRPEDNHQDDESDLMPYPILDAIERAAIRDKLSPVEVYEKLVDKYKDDKLAEYIEKFFKLWCRNQWKRERLAVAFHLDDENLDPKTWCRWPVLSSGLESELAVLREMTCRQGK